MRYLPALAATVLILVASTFAPAAEAERENLVKNGGAEQVEKNLPAGWDMACVRAQGLTLSRDTNEHKSGAASFLIDNRHTYDQPVANNWRQEIKPVPDVGATLRIRAFMKSAGVEDGCNVCVQCWDAGYKNMLAFGSTQPLKGDNDWTAVQSEPIRVPRGTKAVVVRAALGGKGKVWFDDIEVRPVPASGAASEPARPISLATLDPELIKRVDGKVIEVLPVDRDQMILAYLPDWAHGRVDNIAVANNDGGVRTLLGWPAIDSKYADSRLLLALYAREAVNKGDAGAIGAYEVLDDWDEQTSWKTQPKTAEQPAAEFKFENVKGWQLFDVTKIARAKTPSHGVMLRFEDEKQTSDTWSGYAFVSREGDGQWADKQPLLLIAQ